MSCGAGVNHVTVEAVSDTPTSRLEDGTPPESTTFSIKNTKDCTTKVQFYPNFCTFTVQYANMNASTGRI